MDEVGVNDDVGADAVFMIGGKAIGIKLSQWLDLVGRMKELAVGHELLKT